MLDAASGSAEMDERKSTSSKVEEKGSPAVNQEVPPSETAALEKGGGGDGNPEGTHDDRDPPIDPEPDALAVASLPLGLVPSTQGPRETYPEGGLRAWLVVLGSWLILFSSLGIINILATFQAYISSHQLEGQDEGTTGWIFSVYTFLCFFLGVYIGPIFDRYGPRWLILSGTICLAVGLMLVSISTRNTTPFSHHPFVHLANSRLQSTGTSSLLSACSAGRVLPSSSRRPSQQSDTTSSSAAVWRRGSRPRPARWAVWSSRSCCRASSSRSDGAGRYESWRLYA